MTDAGTGPGTSPLIAGPDMSANSDFSEFVTYDDDATLDLLNVNAADLGVKPFEPHDPKAAPTTLGARDLGAAESPDSFRDSSSDSGSSSKRTGHSTMATGDITMMDGAEDMSSRQWTSPYANGAPDDGSYIFDNGPLNDTLATVSDDNFFDFERASSSPDALVNGRNINADSPSMPAFPVNGIKHSTTPSRSRPNPSRTQINATPNFPLTQTMNGLQMAGSREVSPFSQEIASQQASPSAMMATPSHHGNPVDFSQQMYPQMAAAANFWPHPVGDMATAQQMANTIALQHQPMRLDTLWAPPLMPIHCQLEVGQIGPKSRVETQIPIKLTLRGAPSSVRRLHLPTHTIAKPKLLAKPTVERHPDMLELYTQLVCTSAMMDADQRSRALKRAANATHPKIISEQIKSEDKESADPQDRPQNGGEVRICKGCITREQKRAGRKKVKKPEEEEQWKQDETRRVIVFNTTEVKEWKPETTDKANAPPQVPGMVVDAPMRIACYCRHHGEKTGFQVIFTIKDYQNRVVAQALSPSIMITDDHKTHPGLPTTLDAPGMQGNNVAMPMANGISEGGAMDPATTRASPESQIVRGSQSSSNRGPSSSMTSGLAMSRPVSPSSNQGPASKKRKASGSRVPSQLEMTPLDASPTLITPSVPPSQASASAATSPFTPSLNNFGSPDAVFTQGGTGANMAPTFGSGGLGPLARDPPPFSDANRSASMDNLAMPLFSAPASAHPSRAPSPNTLRQGLVPNVMSRGLANGMGFMPAGPSMAHTPQPVMHKIIPGEGPKMGGIEVTILGSGFTEGLVVYFGEQKATTTTFWGEQSLVCLLPPATHAGSVPVTLKQAQSPSQPFTPGQSKFLYLDDEENQLTKMMLGMISQKMTGQILDVRDLAARIMNAPDMQWGNLGPGSSGSGGGFGGNSYSAGTEAQLLKCLELIDLDDSSRMPRLDLRRSATGQAMLHYGCSLGYHRFVAGLLARGANPDLRDRGGFTPMHMAAMNDHEAIVRRLMQAGADPTIRSLSGLRPADLARSRKVVEHIRRCERHVRSRSGGSLHSRANSAASLRSLWDPLTSSAESGPASDSEESPEYSSGDFEDEEDEAEDSFLDMRRPSSHTIGPAGERRASRAPEAGALPVEPGSPTTAMAAAVRDQFAAHLHQWQQAMQIHLPNFGQMPNLPQMPTLPRMPMLPNYQAYLEQSQIMGRMSSLMPNMSGSRPGSPDEHSKPEHAKWWDFSSLLNKEAPPSYSELFPRDREVYDQKQASAAMAANDAVEDAKCARLFDSETREVEVSEQEAEDAVTTTTEPKALKIGRKTAITREQQQDFLRAHAEKFKGMRSDKNLWFIWIPLLTLILAAMLYNRFPDFFAMAWTFVSSLLFGRPVQTTAVTELTGAPEAPVVEVF